MPPPLSSHTPYTTLFRSAPLSQHTEYLKVTAASAEEAIEHCAALVGRVRAEAGDLPVVGRSEEHTSELQSRGHLVFRLLLVIKQHYTYMITLLNDCIHKE